MDVCRLKENTSASYWPHRRDLRSRSVRDPKRLVPSAANRVRASFACMDPQPVA